MTIHEIRNKLKYETKYSGSKNWHDKVDRMGPSQVMAIYYRILSKNEFCKKDEGIF